MSTWGVTTLRLLDALEQHGPMTASEIAALLGRDRDDVSSVLSRLRRPRKQLPKRVYVIDWRDDEEGQRRYYRPVYALGSKPCKKPESYASRVRASRRRSYAAKKQRLFIAQVCAIVHTAQSA